MKVHYSADTHVGQQRQINQDAYGVQDAPQSDAIGQLMVLCDGMGGHMAGEVASRRGVDTILKSYYDSSQDDRIEALREAFQAANTQIYEEGQGTMGTTGVALLLRGNRLDVANVGDSRAYLVRQGQIQQLTEDHSFVWEQVAAGVLTKQQARYSHYRNMITRAIGHRPDVEVDFFIEHIAEGDVLVLSSDGLHGLLDDEEIAQAVDTMLPTDAVHWLIDEANQRGGTDNITVIVVRLEEADGIEGAPPAEADSRADAITQPISAAAHEDDDASSLNVAGASPVQAASVSGWRRGGLWGSVILLLALLGGAAYLIGMGGSFAAPLPMLATETLTPTVPRTPAVSPTATPPLPTPTGRATATPAPTRTSTPALPTARPTPTSTQSVLPAPPTPTTP